MSIKVMNQVWDTPCDTHTQKLVLVALADNSNDQRICWPSIDYLAKRCDLSRNGVMLQIEKLIKAGALKVRKSDGKVNVYEMFPEPEPVHSINQSTPLTSPRCEENQSTPLTPPVHAINPNRKEPSVKPPCIPVNIPKELDTPEFRQAWDEWQQHRKEIKKRQTPLSVAKQLKKMATWGTVRAVAAINHSIESNWQGIYEPKQIQTQPRDPFMPTRPAIHLEQKKPFTGF